MIRAEFNGDDEMPDVGVAGRLDVRRQLAGSLVVAFAIAAFCGLKVLAPPHHVAGRVAAPNNKVAAHNFAVIQSPPVTVRLRARNAAWTSAMLPADSSRVSWPGRNPSSRK